MRTLNDIIKEYKPYEVDFVLPNPKGDVRCNLDLYLMYESKDLEWQEIQTIIFWYFNDLLEKYKSKKISGDQLLSRLNFPEVESLGFGHCVEGVKGKGTHTERAQLIKKAIFDNPEVQKFGIETLAKLTIQIEGFGPDLLSDLVGNFALFNLIKYTQEQVKTFDLKTMSVTLPNGYDFKTKSWKPAIKVDLPYFENGEFRLLVPRHIARRMPILSSTEFYNGYLKYVLQDEEQSRKKIISTIGKAPKVLIKEIEARLEREYETVGHAVKEITKDRPKLIYSYAHNPHVYDSKRKPRKPKILWSKYIEELKSIPTGQENAKKYAEFLRKVFRTMYGDNLLRGKIETRSSDGIYRYDINFLNASETTFFKIIRNHQIKLGLLIIESKNYGKKDVKNEEFNQALSYAIANARELVFLASREPITQLDLNRAKAIYLRHKIIVLPVSDQDIIKLLEHRDLSPDTFDEFLNPRLQEIISA